MAQEPSTQPSSAEHAIEPAWYEIHENLALVAQYIATH